MYLPSHFEETRLDVLHHVIEQFPFGLLVTHFPHGLEANHLPFYLAPGEGELGTLHAHVARNNPVWQALAAGAEVLVVFRAGDAYITPTSYPSKAHDHRQVPTWNYRVVHAHGRAIVRDDARYVRAVVAKLTHRHEASQATPWKMSDAPRDYLDAMTAAIVGLEIPIQRLEGKFKLGQNRTAQDREGAGQALVAAGDGLIGPAMLGQRPGGDV